MTRSELIAALGARFPALLAGDIELSVKALQEALTATLARGERIEIRGFGAFSVRHRAPRLGRNPSTGAAVAVPAKYTTHFKAGLELQQRVDPALASSPAR